MDTKKAKYIIKVADCKNITKAAEALYISQPYLTKTVKSIEEKIGSQLFIRGRNALELTEAGEVYIDYLKKIIDLEKEMMEELNTINEKKHNILSIGTSTWRNEFYLSNILSQFIIKFPNVKVKIYEGGLKPTIDLINRDICDLGLLSDVKIVSNVKTEVLGKDPLVLISPYNANSERLLPKGRTVITAAELQSIADKKFVMYFPEQSIALIINNYLERNKIYFRDTILTRSPGVAMSYVLSGQCYAFQSVSYVCRHNADRLDYYFFDDPAMCYNPAIIYRADKKLNAIERHFIDIAREYVQTNIS